MADRPTYGSMWPIYAKYWDRMTILPERQNEVRDAVVRILGGKSRYLAVNHATSVPWDMTGALHMRESSCNFSRQLGQGDPLGAVSVHEPKGMGPYLTFEESAFDIFARKGYNKILDWRLEKKLYYSENWNGCGYWLYRGNMPSPFLWGATNIQKIGKYVADNKWDPNVWDTQIGVAPVLKLMLEMNVPVKGDIYFKRED